MYNFHRVNKFKGLSHKQNTQSVRSLNAQDSKMWSSLKEAEYSNNAPFTV